jgi:FkbM family methyltransferase
LGPENFCLAAGKNPRVVVDIGVGHTPTFSAWISRESHALVILCDPTPKHSSTLKKWVAAHGNAAFLELALAQTDGMVEFFESALEESGSLVESHTNRSTGGRVVSVQGASLPTLLAKCMSYGPVEFVKVDAEGSEFAVFRPDLEIEQVVSAIPQWFIEFHPVPQTGFPLRNVFAVVHHFKRLGFSAFTPNGVDYLFWRS